MASDDAAEAEVVLKTEEKKLLSALNNLPPMPDISKHFNIQNAKVIAVVVVIGFIVYHGVLLGTLGSDSCEWLLSDGRFQASKWQPFGCMMHKYHNTDARACMHHISYWKGKNHITFIGDNHMKQLFGSFVQRVDTSGKADIPEEEDENILPLEVKSLHQYGNRTNQQVDFMEERKHFESPTIGLYTEFFYYPYLSDKYIAKLKYFADMDEESRPTMLVTGLPLNALPPDPHYSNLFYGEVEDSTEVKSDSQWEDNFKKAAELLNQIHSDDTHVVWNVQEPAFNASKEVNEAIDKHNRVAMEAFDSSDVGLWKTGRLIAQILQRNASNISRTEHSELDTQILLNYICNGKMYYDDGTCCTTTEKPTLLQFISILVFVLCLSLCTIMYCVCKRDVREVKSTAGEEPNGKGYHVRNLSPTWKKTLFDIFWGFGRVGLIVGYSFLCDRTTFFMKENKNYTHLNFFFPLGYVMLIGMFWAQDSTQSTILHRDQTDEWKGWMQLIILIYHFTGASKVLGVYMFVRCLVTSYIFLSAYGNFMYSWKKGDFGVHRFFAVLVRYNLLVICLCMVMNRPYQFYYFVPLITFWYTVMYVTAALWPRVTNKSIDKPMKKLWYLIIKLIILLALITLLYNNETIFEKMFSANPFRPLYITRDNTVHDWWFRWYLDRYASLGGVLFALFVVLGQKYDVIQDKSNDSNLFRNDIVLSLTVLFSISSIAGYALTMIYLCDNKKDCNIIHPYISCLPIVGYIFIRNAIGPIRTLYSPFFAWFGKFALELFVAQYHIWLAADTHGILVLVPNYPVVNVLVTTFIFVCAAHELSAATTKLTALLVPNNWKYLLRNLFIFSSVMVPVAIYSGAFNI